MQNLFVCTVLSLFILSCGESGSERKDGYSETPKSLGDSLFHSVMEGHDEAMAKMGKLKSYQEQISKKIDLFGKEASREAKLFVDSLRRTNADLRAAEEKMNRWMDKFSVDSAQSESGNRVKYLRVQDDQVEAIKQKILKALDKADSVLRK